MKDILMDILIIIVLPFAIILAIWDGFIAFIKAFVKRLKDWSDFL